MCLDEVLPSEQYSPVQGVKTRSAAPLRTACLSCREAVYWESVRCDNAECQTVGQEEYSVI